jgi:GntR family transcriptional regulator of arabinose operon
MDKQTLPKYLVLQNQLAEWIESGQLQVGQLVPSENELTQRFGVSRHTVRQAFTRLEQDGWIERVQGKGTYLKNPKITISQDQQLRTIGMITTYISDYIFPHIIRGAELALRTRGYQLILSSTDNDKHKEREVLHKMLEQQVAGIIIEPTKSAEGNLNESLFNQLHMKRIPFLMINERYEGVNCPCVKVNDELGAFMATEHLFRLGHRKIIGFFKTDDLQGVHRLAGFKRAYTQYGAVLDDEDVIGYCTEEKSSKPYEQAITILQRPSNRPTAFVCYNDELAVKLLDVVRHLGLTIPDDLSIVGFDDSALATATEVKLTSVTHPKSAIGQKAAELLIDWIEGRSDGEQIQDLIFEPRLTLRDSVKSI